MPEAGSAVDGELIPFPPPPSTSPLSRLCSGCQCCAWAGAPVHGTASTRALHAHQRVCVGIRECLHSVWVCISLSPSPRWWCAPAETFLELPPSSCMGRSYRSVSRFSLPLCPYDIRLWSLITRADAWYPDGPANGAQSSKSPLLCPVSLSLAVALTLTSPRHSSLGGRRGTGIPADVGDAPGTKESAGSSWPRLAPLVSG